MPKTNEVEKSGGGATNPLKGIISDEAFAEIKRLTKSVEGVTDKDTLIATGKKGVRVITSELDVADGAADGQIQTATLARKLEAISKFKPDFMGIPLDGIKDKLKELPASIPADKVNKQLDAAIENIAAKMKESNTTLDYDNEFIPPKTQPKTIVPSTVVSSKKGIGTVG